MVFAIFYDDLLVLVTIRIVKKANDYGDVYFLQLLKPLIVPKNYDYVYNFIYAFMYVCDCICWNTVYAKVYKCSNRATPNKIFG